jgi:hypothetical protein
MLLQLLLCIPQEIAAADVQHQPYQGQHYAAAAASGQAPVHHDTLHGQKNIHRANEGFQLP